MRKEKNILCICLIIVMLISSVSFAFADIENDYFCEDESKYTLETIYFSNGFTANKKSMRKRTDEKVEINTVADTVQQRYEATKKFVESLNYGEAIDIKEAVLEDLESIKNSGAEIEKYTVYIPKATISPSQLTRLGSKNGFDFYYRTLAEKTVNITSNKETKSGTIKSFVSGGVDIIFCFMSNKISVAYSLARTFLGLPAGVTITDGTEVESILKLSSKVREIYTQDIMKKYGNNTSAFVRIYSGDAGYARPYIRMGFPTSASIPEKSNWIGDGKYCQTDNYSNLEQFAQIYSLGLEAREKLVNKVSTNAKIYWE